MMLTLKKIITKFFKWYFVGLVVCALLFYGISFYYHAVGAKKEFSAPTISFTNQFGETKSVKDYKGKTILIDFWFAGCKPCMEEMRYYPDLLEKYRDELVILSCTIEATPLLNHLLENRPFPWDFLIKEKRNWVFFSDWPSCADTLKGNSFTELLSVKEYPTYFIINKNGQMIDSPRSGLFGVEKELSGYFGLNLALRKFTNSDYIKRHSVSFIIIFNILAAGILFVSILIELVGGYFRKT
jgi:thiol-disulfide isomerase/thioredoxin